MSVVRLVIECLIESTASRTDAVPVAIQDIRTRLQQQLWQPSTQLPNAAIIKAELVEDDNAD